MLCEEGYDLADEPLTRKELHVVVVRLWDEQPSLRSGCRLVDPPAVCDGYHLVPCTGNHQQRSRDTTDLFDGGVAVPQEELKRQERVMHATDINKRRQGRAQHKRAR